MKRHTLISFDRRATLIVVPVTIIRTAYTVTASKTETVYEFSLDNIMALGLIRRNFKVISRSLPMGLGIDGLLGINFFHNKELNINFRLSEIQLS